MFDAAFRDRAVYLRASRTLVVADLHVGRAEASAVAYPLGERSDLESRLRALLAAFAPDEVVVAGDVLHRFGSVSERAEATLTALVAACRDAGATPTLVAGNHDTALSEIWDESLEDAVFVGDDTLVCHGHVEPDAEAARYVVGHDHPAITIEGRTYPCFLYGPETFRGGDVLVVPAFTRLAGGVRVNDRTASDFQSPLVTDADALHPLVYDADREETLTFPPLGTFRKHL